MCARHDASRGFKRAIARNTQSSATTHPCDSTAETLLGLREQLLRPPLVLGRATARGLMILANPNLERDGKGGIGSSWCFNSSFAAVPQRASDAHRSPLGLAAPLVPGTWRFSAQKPGGRSGGGRGAERCRSPRHLRARPAAASDSSRGSGPRRTSRTPRALRYLALASRVPLVGSRSRPREQGGQGMSARAHLARRSSRSRRGRPQPRARVPRPRARRRDPSWRARAPRPPPAAPRVATTPAPPPSRTVDEVSLETVAASAPERSSRTTRGDRADDARLPQRLARRRPRRRRRHGRGDELSGTRTSACALRRLERVPRKNPPLARRLRRDLPRDAEGWYKAVITRPDRVDEWSADEDRRLPPPADPKRANATLFQETAAYAAQHGRAAEQPERRHPLRALAARNNVVVAASASADASVVRVDAVSPRPSSGSSPRAGGTPSVLATVRRATARLQPRATPRSSVPPRARRVGPHGRVRAHDVVRGRPVDVPRARWTRSPRSARSTRRAPRRGSTSSSRSSTRERRDVAKSGPPRRGARARGADFRLAREADAGGRQARMRQWLAGEGFELSRREAEERRGTSVRGEGRGGEQPRGSSTRARAGRVRRGRPRRLAAEIGRTRSGCRVRRTRRWRPRRSSRRLPSRRLLSRRLLAPERESEPARSSLVGRGGPSRRSRDRRRRRPRRGLRARTRRRRRERPRARGCGKGVGGVGDAGGRERSPLAPAHADEDPDPDPRALGGVSVIGGGRRAGRGAAAKAAASEADGASRGDPRGGLRDPGRAQGRPREGAEDVRRVDQIVERRRGGGGDGEGEEEGDDVRPRAGVRRGPDDD